MWIKLQIRCAEDLVHEMPRMLEQTQRPIRQRPTHHSRHPERSRNPSMPWNRPQVTNVGGQVLTLADAACRECDRKSQINKLLGSVRYWRLQYWPDDGRILKVALFPGPPSIEKTTCAAIACKRLRIEMLDAGVKRVPQQKVSIL
ncbi:hypothetical protein L596_001484 [Steinernema carpocapsae]|uniref:Uncharacterized protein n=1 Tax=Steinernema carpocapsae TaxID=34508 RepID=A0A4U8UNY5_STECR|nr:hypothetical protein L596_001484 [Steinernema carpocapsae]